MAVWSQVQSPVGAGLAYDLYAVRPLWQNSANAAAVAAMCYVFTFYLLPSIYVVYLRNSELTVAYMLTYHQLGNSQLGYKKIGRLGDRISG